MRVMRVPRSGSMILTMLVALVATWMLPVVFMAALSASADPHPKRLGPALRDLSRPVVAGVERLLARWR